MAQNKKTPDMKIKIQSGCMQVGSSNIININSRGATSGTFTLKMSPYKFLTDKYLWRLSSNISKYVDLGIHLELPFATVQQIEANFPKDSNRCLFEILHFWRQICIGKNKSECEAVENLKAALKDIGRMDVHDSVDDEYRNSPYHVQESGDKNKLIGGGC